MNINSLSGHDGQPALVATLPEPQGVSAHSCDGQAQLEAGAWCIARSSGYGWRDSYTVALVERVTKKIVYAKPKSTGRMWGVRQYQRDAVLLMPDEASAHALMKQVESAQNEANRRINAAAAWGRQAVAKLLEKPA